MRKFLAFLGLSVLALLASAAGKQPITGADVLKIRNVASVAVASDGSFAVYGVQSIHTDPPADAKGEPTYKYRTHLWRIDLNNPNAQPEQLTFGDRSDSSPAISPDNRTLAFVRVDTAGARPPVRRSGCCRCAVPAKRRPSRNWRTAPRRPSGGPTARRCW